MQISFPPLVDDDEIIRLVGDSSFKRGRTYARKEHVFDIGSEASSLELIGKVQGNRPAPYRTKVRFSLLSDRIRPERGICSCPMHLDCKHAAALLLASNQDLTSPTTIIAASPSFKENGDMLPGMPEMKPTLAKKPGKKRTPAKRQLRSATSSSAEQPTRWQDQLQSLIDPNGRAANQRSGGYWPLSSSVMPTPLGVQLQLQQSPHRSSRYYVGRDDPWRDQALPPLALTARPVKRNEKGKWVVAQLRWDTFRHAPTAPAEFDGDQVRWMQSFAAVYSVSGPRFASDSFIQLEQYSNPLLWDLLAKAADVGVQLVNAKAGADVVIHDPVTVSLDIRRGEGLHLSPRAECDGHILDRASMGIIGQEGHGLFWQDDGVFEERSAATIHLAPTVTPVPASIRPLVTNRTALEIPESGQETFLSTHLPQLAKTTTVISSDDSVDLPRIVPPMLVLKAAHIADTTHRGTAVKSGKTASSQNPGELHLHWNWEYSSADTVTRCSMVHDSNRFRDQAAEKAALDQIRDKLADFPTAWQEQFPDVLTGHSGSAEPAILRQVAAARFVNEALPLLEGLEHLRVDTSGDLPDYAELTSTPRIAIKTESTEDNDWFDLGLTVALGDTDVPFDELFRALASGQEHLMLSNGNYFQLDQPEFLLLRRLIEEARALQDKDSDGLKISRYQAGLWDELEELAATSEQAEAWRSSVSGLLQLSEIPPIPVPAGINATMRPYQQEGFTWLAFLYEHGLGGVLADDMGLGKTLQALALICHAKDTAGDGPIPTQKPFLVVAPTSVVPNWAAEASRFAPHLRTTEVTDTLRRSGADPAAIAEGADVVIVSYTLFRLDYEAYAAQEWAGLILDEAQFAKNPATKTGQNARMFGSPFKLAITGTPMENNLTELWSMFAITAPGLFPTLKNFEEYYRKPVEKEANSERMAQLRRRIRPLMMRRTKELVAKDLPPKQEQVLELELAPRHRTIYQRHLQRERQKVLDLLDDMDTNRFEIFRSLTMLRRLSLDASLVDEKYSSTPSSKLDVLLEQLEDIVAEGHRTLIFSQFTSFLGKAAERLDMAGIEYAYLDGSTRSRAKVIEKFKSGTAPVFLISLKAGGFGLNLTEADYCFLLDPWWNPATENQAVDRTHRIGQDKNVMVYRLVAKDTIEEKVMALKERKAELFSSVLDEGAMFSSALSAEDVRGLFEH